MIKRVLDVGNCGPDFAAVRHLLRKHFECEVTQCHGLEDARQQLQDRPAHLVLVNRKLDRDYSEGLEVIRQLKADPDFADVPMMLVTNFPEYQQQAVAEGAVLGFGKLQFDAPETTERLARFLSRR